MSELLVSSRPACPTCDSLGLVFVVNDEANGNAEICRTPNGCATLQTYVCRQDARTGKWDHYKIATVVGHAHE